MVKYQGDGDNPVTIFTLATSKAYNSREGSAIIETEWHNVVARAGKEVQGLEKVEKGSKVYVKGRLRTQKFTGSDGTERYSKDVIANKLLVLSDVEGLSTEM